MAWARPQPGADVRAFRRTPDRRRRRPPCAEPGSRLWLRGVKHAACAPRARGRRHGVTTSGRGRRLFRGSQESRRTELDCHRSGPPGPAKGACTPLTADTHARGSPRLAAPGAPGLASGTSKERADAMRPPQTPGAPRQCRPRRALGTEEAAGGLRAAPGRREGLRSVLGERGACRGRGHTARDDVGRGQRP